MVGTKRPVDLKELPTAWEGIRSIRNQIQGGRSLMVSTVAGMAGVLGNLKDCSENSECLMAILERMKASLTCDTPGVDILSVACRVALELCRYDDQEGLAAVAHRDAWGMKRCLSTLRRKWARNETPKDCCAKNLYIFYRG